MLFLALYRVFKSMEPLFFDRPEENDVVRRSSKSTKAVVSAQGRNRALDLPYGKLI